MKLFLVRHGQTIENVNDTTLGHGQGTLSDLGQEQVKKAAIRLKDEKFDAIFSSDLRRAKDTALAIAKYHPDTPITFAEELRERNFYDFEGQPVSTIDWDNIRDKIESRQSLRERAKIILDKAYQKYPNGVVLFVGHSGINRALTVLIMNKPPEYMKELENFKNASVSIFEIKEDKNHQVILLNCAKHLD
jgi:broad specificity phosphatase PhoE